MRQASATVENDGVVLDKTNVQKGCKMPGLLPRHIADVVPLSITNTDGPLVVVISMVPQRRDSLEKQ